MSVSLRFGECTAQLCAHLGGRFSLGHQNWRARAREGCSRSRLRRLVKMARATTDDSEPDASALPGITREEGRAMALDALGAAGANDEEKTAEARTAARMGVSLMSDEARGAAYRLAVETQARDTDLVLDVGGGVGLLGVVAARAGAKRVVVIRAHHGGHASSVALANNIGETDSTSSTRASPTRAPTDPTRGASARKRPSSARSSTSPTPARTSSPPSPSRGGPGPAANLRRTPRTLLSPGYACVPAAAVVRAQVVTSAHLRDSITLRPPRRRLRSRGPRLVSRSRPRTGSRRCAERRDARVVAVSEPCEAFRVDFANLPPETVETRAIVPIVLGDEQRSAAAEALAVAYWWTCDATKSPSSAKSTASSPPARGSPTRRLAILPTPVRIPEDATTLVVSIVRDDDRVRFRKSRARARTRRARTRSEDPEDEDPARAQGGPVRGGGGVSVSRPRPEHVLSRSRGTARESRVGTRATFRDAGVAGPRAVRFPVCPFHRRVRVDASDGPALAILAADAGAKGVLSLETTREGAVSLEDSRARACGVADVVHACAARFDRDETLARTNLRTNILEASNLRTNILEASTHRLRRSIRSPSRRRRRRSDPRVSRGENSGDESARRGRRRRRQSSRTNPP